MNAIAKILVAGLISGAVSGLLVDFFEEATYYWAPGLVFGAIFGVVAVAPVSAFRAFAFAILSTAAYRVAVLVAQQVIAGALVPLRTDVQEERFWIAGIIGGVVGAAILAASTWLLKVGRIDFARGVAAVIAGAATGAILHFWPIRAGAVHVGAYLLFVPWQCAVALLLFRVRPERPAAA